MGSPVSAGDLWRLPDGRKALELDGSSGGQLRVSPLAPKDWPFQLTGSEVVAKALCTQLPSRYLNQPQPGPDKPNPADAPDALI
jgi:hypothetical protein